MSRFDDARNEKMNGTEFGFRASFLIHQLEWMALKGIVCDITLKSGKPHIDVTIEPKFSHALMYGAGAKDVRGMLSEIRLSNGQTLDFADIWTIHPMPKGGVDPERLADVDLSHAEEKSGPNGETIREMISATYHCESREEEDRYLRRFFAS